MAVLFWTALGFICGSIPFSVIIGKLVSGVDIREYGDHNPGATNVLRSLGWGWAALALLLDGLKGALPVGYAWFALHLDGLGIVSIALAPIIGHAYSPWLKFHGGKAVATTFGVWAGLTIGAGPTVLGLLLGLMYGVFQPSGWSMILAMLSFGGYIGAYYGSTHPEYVWVWCGNLLILLLRHWRELITRPGIRAGVFSLFRR